MSSETSKWRHLTTPYCQGGPGLDLGSGGDPVVPWAISVDLPPDAAAAYDTTHFGGSIHIAASAWGLPWFTDQTLAWVYSSHLLEDAPFTEWPRILFEWCRVVRPGGHLVLLVPDRERFRAVVAAGQPDNPNHRHEAAVGELTSLVGTFPGWEVLEDRFCDGTDYSILFVARRVE